MHLFTILLSILLVLTGINTKPENSPASDHTQVLAQKQSTPSDEIIRLIRVISRYGLQAGTNLIIKKEDWDCLLSIQHLYQSNPEGTFNCCYPISIDDQVKQNITHSFVLPITGSEVKNRSQHDILADNFCLPTDFNGVLVIHLQAGDVFINPIDKNKYIHCTLVHLCETIMDIGINGPNRADMPGSFQEIALNPGSFNKLDGSFNGFRAFIRTLDK